MALCMLVPRPRSLFLSDHPRADLLHLLLQGRSNDEYYDAKCHLYWLRQLGSVPPLTDWNCQRSFNQVIRRTSR